MMFQSNGFFLPDSLIYRNSIFLKALPHLTFIKIHEAV